MVELGLDDVPSHAAVQVIASCTQTVCALSGIAATEREPTFATTLDKVVETARGGRPATNPASLYKVRRVAPPPRGAVGRRRCDSAHVLPLQTFSECYAAMPEPARVAGFSCEASGMLAILEAAKGRKRLIAPVSLVRHKACLTTCGKWIRHRPERFEAPAVKVDTTGMCGLLQVFAETIRPTTAGFTCKEVRWCAVVCCRRRSVLAPHTGACFTGCWHGHQVAFPVTKSRTRVELLGCPPLLIFDLDRRTDEGTKSLHTYGAVRELAQHAYAHPR